MTADGIPIGFTFTAAAEGSQKDAGSSDSTVTSYTIYNETEEDVTDSFTDIHTVKGTLTVNKKSVTISTGSASKEYDGTALTITEAGITGLVTGETATVTATGSQTEVGSSTNAYSIAWGTAKEGNYEITESLGTLEVTANSGAIVFTAPTAEKTYDGTALTAGEVTAEGIPTGFTFTAAAEGSQKDAGSSDSTVTSYTIYNETEEDVTDSFTDIHTVKGTLTVNKKSVTISTGSASKEYDGTALTITEAGITGLVTGETATVTATGSQTEVGSSTNAYSIAWGTAKEGNYEITESLGTLEVTANRTKITITAPTASQTYDGTMLAPTDSPTVTGLDDIFTLTVTYSGGQKDAGSSDYEVSGYTIKNAANEDVTDRFTNVEKVKGTLTVNKKDVTVSTGSGSKEYDGTALTSTEAGIAGLVTGETATVTATGSQTEIGGSANTYTIDWGTTNKDNYEITEELGTLEVTANSGAIVFTAPTAEKTYDGTALTAGEVTAEGIPTGFTFTAAAEGSQKDAGSSDSTVTSYTIYNETEEDVTDSFTDIHTVKGTLTVNKKSVTISTGSASKEYDGTALTITEAGITGLVTGETATVTATGSQTEVGSSTNAYSIAWGTAKEGNYEITESLGTLEVTANSGAIVFTAPTAEKTYDGTALTAGEVTAEGIPTGFTFTAAAEGSQMDAGSSDSTVTGYTIYKGTTDVTASFTNIQTVKGTLTVNKKPVTVSTGSASKEYDGTALTNATASITGLVTGETATVTAAGSQTAVGSSSNGYSIAWGETNADNYTVEESLGTLEVTNHTSEVKLTAPSDSQTYNGAPLTAPTDAPASEGLPVGFTVTASYSGSRTDAGTGASQIEEYQIINGNGEDVAGWFTNVTKVNGVLTVNPKEATVTTGSASKAYDGTALTKAEASITGLAAVDEDKVTIAATGSQTEIGFSSNTYSIRWGTVNADNYAITEDLGTLTVTGAETIVVDASAKKMFDGTPLTADSGTLAVTGLPEGFTVEAEVSGSQKSAGSSDVTFISCRIRKAGEDVTGLFTVETKGTLTVDKFPVVISTESITKEYDGEVLTGGTVTINGEEPTWVESSYFFELPGGAWIEYSPLDYGPAEVGDGPVTNGGGYEIYGVEGGYDYENDYHIITEYGTLRITPRIVTLMLDGLKDDIVYDGEFHGEGLEVDAGKYGAGSDYAGSSIAVALTACGDGQWQVEMPWEDMIDVSISDGGCDADTYTLACEWEVSFGASDNYSISAVGQEMTIHPRPVIIEGDDYEKPYDGEAFVRAADMEWPVKGEMIYGHITSDQIYPGEGSLYFAIDEYPEYTNPANYVITVTGSLTVTKNFTPITITAPSDEQYYNGAPLLEPTDAPWVEGLPDGYWAEATKEEGKERTNVGSTPIGVTDYTIYNSDNADVTECFGNVTKVPGSLKVKPTKIVLETSYDMYSGDGTNVYGLNSVDAYIDEGPWWYTISAEKIDDFTWTITVVNLDESFTLTAAVIAEYNEMGDDYEYSLDSDLSGACLSNYVVSIEDQGAFGLISGFGSGVAFRAGPNQQEQPRLSRPAALLRAAGRDEQQKTTVLCRSRYVSISPKA